VSHLSNIISRIESEIERLDDPMNEGIMQRHVKNLREYPSVWDDATEEELQRRKEFLEERPWVADSHYLVECLNKECEWEKEVGSEKKAREEGEKHANINSSYPDEHATFWELEVETPAREKAGDIIE
jgi:hypothetical protein